MKLENFSSLWLYAARSGAFFLLVSVVVGCAHSRDESSTFIRVHTPQVPAFLCGPAARLLAFSTATPEDGYSARLLAEPEPVLAHEGPLEGELLARGSRLAFFPKERAEKEGSGFSYVWDVATGSGFVLSEALQAYAPVSTSVSVTNMSVRSAVSLSASEPEPCVVYMSDGSSAQFQVWRQGARSQVPTKIASVRLSPPVNLTLSKIRLGLPPASEFSPPDGFSKYPTPAALANELAARRHNLRRGHQEMPVPLEPTPQGVPTYR
jgi:hypothetical protein